jgi:hypothetical protein
MTNRLVLLSTVVAFAVIVGCGDDDDTPADRDGGADGSVDSGGPEAGRGGRGGAGGRIGSGTAGQSGAGAGGAAAGEGGAGGAAGEGGSSGGTKYSVGGEVTGLSGTGLVLQNNAGDDLAIAAAGSFKFATELGTEDAYEVTVKTQPSSPSQTCTVSDGTGDVGNEDVSSVKVACATNKYKVGGTITGLTGTGLVLNNNGGDALNASGASFEFATSLDSGADYAVTVATQPSNQVCAVEMASGEVAGANVTTVAVACHAKTVLQVAPGFGNAIASWSDTGAASYTLKLTTSATCDLETPGCPGAVEIATVTSPTTVPSLTNGTPYYFQVTANYPGGVKSLSNKTAARPSQARLDGNVFALATAASGVTYAGGAFTRLSVHTGAATPVSKTTGLPSEIPNFPLVDGDVFAVAADGTGGYYIGGAFTAVGGVLRNGLAHIKSDGTLDSAFDVDIAVGSVRTIEVRGTTVYLAGSFATVATVARTGLAAVNAADGALVAGFNPVVVPTGTVSALAFIGTNVVAGGEFTSIGGGAQANLAQIDGATGAIVATWAPAPNGAVNTIVATSDLVYVGGEFQTIGGMPRSRLAALNATGAMAGQPTAWAPDPDQAVSQIAVANNSVYIAGAFANVGTSPRRGLAAIDVAGAGAVRDWNPTLAPNTSGVTALGASADTVYVTGTFNKVDDSVRNGAAAFSAGGTGALTAWDPNPDAAVSGLAVSGESVVLGGSQRGLGGVARSHLVAFGAAGEVTTWNPGADGDVYALLASGAKVYVGGAFTSLGGMTRNRIGAVADGGTGALDPFNPDANMNVYAFALAGTTLYVGGGFTTIGGSPRAAIAALDTAVAAGTAAPTWNPGANSNVRALSLQGTTLYAGGNFTTFGSNTAARNHAAAVLTTTDVATAWDPNVTGTSVNALASSVDTVYIGGDFSALGVGGATARTFLAAVDLNGVATPFNPGPSGIVHALLLDSGNLYAGGEFITTITPAATVNHYAGYDNTGTFRGNDYIFAFDLSVRALSLGANAVYVGGDFLALNGEYTSGFASVPK